MRKIVAIGGGEMRSLETLAIDEEVLRLARTARPRALFIPTASYDSVDYWEAFQHVYGEELGCATDVLYLLENVPPSENIEEQILSSDLIYGGGGNTLKMMRRWRKLGVDGMLERAYAKGIVLAGVSAGAMCWFSHGHSDSMAFYHPDDWSYIRVRGMGLIHAFACPHYDGETAGVKREQDFQQMVKKQGGMGVAIDNCCARELVDEEFRVITTRPGPGVYRVYRACGGVAVEQVPQKPDFTAISTLLQT